MKQTRKNKTNQTVIWPTTPYFTIQDLFHLNPKFVEITLRVRLSNAINPGGTIAEIGSIPGGLGRPQKVFAMTPVTQELLNKAKAAGINLVDNAEEKLVKVISVTNTASVLSAPVASSPTTTVVTH